MDDLWPSIAGHLERWRGSEPLALTPGIRLLERGLELVGPEDAPDPARWAQVLDAGTGALARLVELSHDSDATVAEAASDRAAVLAPLLTKMAGESTQKLARIWRSA
jgi:hypothetical protein